MSAPSSDGRPSVDSEPSVTSSFTYGSRNSGAHAYNGEGSSSARHSLGSAPTVSANNEAERSGSGSPLAQKPIDEQDFARRRERVHRSGGFLLESNFPSGPRSRHEHQAPAEDRKGKRSSRHHGTQDGHGQEKRRVKTRPPTGNSPLSREMQVDGQRAVYGGLLVDMADSQQQDNSELRVGKTRRSAYSEHLSTYDPNPAPNTALQPQPIDPTQLVHMALNLSESRRRNISTGQMLAAQSRAPSSGGPRDGSFSNPGAGGSLRQYLNEQRRASRNISPMGKGSPSRHMSTSMQRSGSMAFPSSQSFNPSPATLARVEKARAYIELQIEYIRLLEYLPPLKPDANAPGNFIVTSNNMPGSSHAQLTRVPSYASKQYDLGRPYNPLQYIRNRRSRARERRALDHSSAEFADIDEVREWVDRVEQCSRRPGYRRDDVVQLPKLHADHAVAPEPSKSARPHKGWIFSAEELLADAHWLEQGDNKILAENRHGRRIFPPREVKQQDFLQPRPSKDYSDKRRRSWVDGVPGVTIDPTTGDESDKGSERGRKRRLLTALRTDSPRGGKHSRRGSRLRNKDDTDSSDSGSDNGKRKVRLAADAEHNIGPLALLLEQQAKQLQTTSPSIISPDTPDKWGRKDIDRSHDRDARDSLEVPRFRNGFAYINDQGASKVPPKPRKKPALSIDDTEARSSFEDWDSTAPNTPLHPKRFPHIGTELSPPPSRAGSENRRSKRSKLNIFHSQGHGDDTSKREIRPESAGTDKNGRSRQTSEETSEDKYIGTAIPGAVRNLLGHRKNDSVSSLPSPDKLRRRETQEPHSAVGRFLKGVKHEGNKVGEFIFRRDRPDDSEADSDAEHESFDIETDTSAKSRRINRPPVSRTVTSGSVNSIASEQPNRGHLDLPSFRPVHESQFRDNNGADLEHHISRQTRERKNSRSPRVDKLLPPKMDLGTISGNASTTSLSPTRSHGQDRMQKLLARPGDNLAGLPVTAMRKPQGSNDRQRSSSRPTLDGKRHWSIADDDEHILHRRRNPNAVTQADIARVRALFLCSGIKAKEISRRAYSSRVPAPEFLTRAAATAETKLVPVAKKEEHVLAARILVKDLESSSKSLQASLESFRDKAIKELTSKISGLQSLVESDLMTRVLEGGDKSIRITSAISGEGPLEVKQITDEVDRMLRARRRQTRWIRGLGWMMVEWALVAIMWCLWLMVVLVGSVKRVFCLGIGVVRWLLWL